MHILALFGVVWLVLKQDGRQLPHGAGRAAAVHQIGKGLLGLAAGKMQRLTVGREHIKVAKAAHPQQRRYAGIAQV